MRWPALWLLIAALIVAPFLVFGDALSAWTTRHLASGLSSAVKAILIGGLLALDVVLPVPSSLVSTAAGALLGFWAGTAACWCGMTAGCFLGYSLGDRGFRRFVAPRDIERVSDAAARYGHWFLILFRAVPVLAEASVLFAGLSGMRRGRFLLLVSASNLGVSLAYAAVGAFSVRVESFLIAFAGSILLPLAALWVARRFP